MKVVVIAPAGAINEWKKVPVPASDAPTVFYSVIEGIQALPVEPDAILYLYPEQDTDTLNWLKQLTVPVCIVNSVIATTSDLGEEFIRINAWPGFMGRTKAEMASAAGKNPQEAVSVMQFLGRETEWVADCCGMLTPRVVASIINEAYFAMEDEVSTATEIDTAMKMGTNYPYGPFEWGKMIGLKRIFNLLENLATNQKRYTPSSLLKNEALA